MEVKEIQAESLKTLENLTEAVDYYRQIAQEIDRLQLSKEIAKEAILEQFRKTSMRYYDTPSGLRARTYVREGQKRIDIMEARALLDADTFNKLLKVGQPIVVLSVKPVKAEENNA